MNTDPRTQPIPPRHAPPYPPPGHWPPGPPGYGPPAPTPPGPPPRRRRGRLVAGLLTAVVVGGIGFAIRANPAKPTSSPPPIVGTSTSAAPTSDAPTVLSAFDLKPGDCYTAGPMPADGTTAVVVSVQSVPCTQPHTAQVVAVPNYADKTYDEAINRLSMADCTREFQNRLRTTALKDKRYRLGRIYPDQLAWNRRSTSVACVVVTEAPTTGSALRG